MALARSSVLSWAQRYCFSSPKALSEIVVAFGWEVPGIKQLIYGIVLFAVIVFRAPRHLVHAGAQASRCVQ